MKASIGTNEPSSARATRRHIRVPAFLRELTTDPVSFRTLVAACAAIAAISLFPRLFDPAMPLMRAAVKQDPQIRSLLTVGAVMQAGWLLVGGAVGDLFRSERFVRVALVGLVVSAFIVVVSPNGPGYVLSAMVGGISVAMVLPFAIGAVAMTYRGPARGTAIGVIYAVFGAGSAASPALALINGPNGSPWPAFVACAVCAVLAIAITARLPDLPGAPPEHRPVIVAVALFAFGVIAIAAAVLQLGVGFDALRAFLIMAGAAALWVSFVLRRRASRGLREMGVDFRAVGVALAIGVAIGFAQAVPMLQVPQFWMVVQGLHPLMATVAIAPFVVALFACGPICGWLLVRIGPRTLIGGGAIAIGLADLLIAASLNRDARYESFVLPLVLIGGGFVVGTTVRTAIIFASVPRRLPASAAALNEASVGIGSLVGVVVALVVTVQTALDSYRAQLADLRPVAIDPLVATARDLINAYGLRPLEALLANIDSATLEQYRRAIVDAMHVAETIPGMIAIAAGVIGFVAMGSRDPVRSVWELADERPPPTD
jgi:MFS family permease